MTAPSPTPDPAAGRAPIARRGARDTLVPGSAGRAVLPSPVGRAAPQSSPQPRERASAAGTPGPETAPAPLLPGQAAVRARDTSPVGGALDGARGVPAGSRGLRGKDFRDAMRRAQTGRKTTRAAAIKRPVMPMPEPAAGGAEITATAHCIDRCEWTAGPGDPAEVDKLAATHTEKPPKHPTAVVAGLRTGATA